MNLLELLIYLFVCSLRDFTNHEKSTIKNETIVISINC